MAKALKRMVYKDHSPRPEARKYAEVRFAPAHQFSNGITIVALGLRKVYSNAKKMFNQQNWREK